MNDFDVQVVTGIMEFRCHQIWPQESLVIKATSKEQWEALLKAAQENGFRWQTGAPAEHQDAWNYFNIDDGYLYLVLTKDKFGNGKEEITLSFSDMEDCVWLARHFYVYDESWKLIVGKDLEENK